MSNLYYELTTVIPFFLTKLLFSILTVFIMSIKNMGHFKLNVIICSSMTILTSVSFYINDTIPIVDPSIIIASGILSFSMIGSIFYLKNKVKVENIYNSIFLSLIGIFIGMGFTIIPLSIALFYILIDEKVK